MHVAIVVMPSLIVEATLKDGLHFSIIELPAGLRGLRYVLRKPGPPIKFGSEIVDKTSFLLGQNYGLLTLVKEQVLRIKRSGKGETQYGATYCSTAAYDILKLMSLVKGRYDGVPFSPLTS